MNQPLGNLDEMEAIFKRLPLGKEQGAGVRVINEARTLLLKIYPPFIDAWGEVEFSKFYPDEGRFPGFKGKRHQKLSRGEFERDWKVNVFEVSPSTNEPPSPRKMGRALKQRRSPVDEHPVPNSPWTFVSNFAHAVNVITPDQAAKRMIRLFPHSPIAALHVHLGYEISEIMEEIQALQEEWKDAASKISGDYCARMNPGLKGEEEAKRIRGHLEKHNFYDYRADLDVNWFELFRLFAWKNWSATQLNQREKKTSSWISNKIKGMVGFIDPNPERRNAWLKQQQRTNAAKNKAAK